MADIRYDFVVFSDDWGRHPSSCQHLFGHLARRHRVLWVNTIGLRAPRADRFTVQRGLEKLGQWARPLRQIDENFWVYSPWMLPAAGGLAGAVNARFVCLCLQRVLARCGLERPVLFASVPTAADYVDKLHEQALVYYITDDYRRWPGADAQHVAAQDRLLSERADLLLPCGTALAQNRQARGRVELLPHAVDLAADEPADLAAIPHPRLGFFGLIYEKIDLGLFEKLARSDPRRHLVLIGPIKTDISALAALPNVHVLGAKPYAELPRYLHGLDVLLLAYVLVEQTLRNAPLKIR
jgi:glycosyltransferase involved in cell wall biosynthesis